MLESLMYTPYTVSVSSGVLGLASFFTLSWCNDLIILSCLSNEIHTKTLMLSKANLVEITQSLVPSDVRFNNKPVYLYNNTLLE